MIIQRQILNTWLQPKKDYFAMTEETYISLTISELYTYKYIGHEYFVNQSF